MLKKCWAFSKRMGPRTVWEISLWANSSERTFYRETCFINWAIERGINANLIVYVDMIINQVCQCKVWKVLWNKSRKVRIFVYARMLACKPTSSTLNCYVNGKNYWIKRHLSLAVVKKSSKYKKDTISCRSIFDIVFL